MECMKVVIVVSLMNFVSSVILSYAAATMLLCSPLLGSDAIFFYILPIKLPCLDLFHIWKKLMNVAWDISLYIDIFF